MTGSYDNLIGEIAKARLRNSEIAKALKVHPNTLRNKLYGESPFTVEEAFEIKRCFFPSYDLMYLFARSGQ